MTDSRSPLPGRIVSRLVWRRATLTLWLSCVATLVGSAGCDAPESNPATDTPVSITEHSRQSAQRTDVTPRPPNLVIVTLDTLRADALGCYGQRRATSPHIDRIAADGVLFERAVTSAAETLPSHASLFTGLHPFEHGVRSNAGFVLAEQSQTLAEMLGDAGYITGAEVAAPVLDRKTQITQGFVHYRGPENADVQLKQVLHKGSTIPVTKSMRTGADITLRGIEFMERHRRRPFFLWLHYFDTHDPYFAPWPHRGRFPGEPYFDEVAGVDAEIGRLAEAIERLGLRGTTLLVITSDHGEGLGQHGELSHAFFVYDSTMRVPLIFWGLEGLPGARRVKGLARTVDLVPTALELLGQPALGGLRGRSLLAGMRRGAIGEPSIGYGEATSLLRIFGIPPLRFIERERWKYIHKQNPELYDVVADPREFDNRIAAEPEIAASLLGELEVMLRSADGSAASEDVAGGLDAEAVRQLEALGYLFVGERVEVGDELASLSLTGRDPNLLIADVVKVSIASGHNQVGRFEEGRLGVEPLLRQDPQNAFLQDVMRVALVGLERFEEALPLLRARTGRTPDEAQGWLGLAEAQYALGRPRAALATLSEGLGHSACAESLHAQAERWLRDDAAWTQLLEQLERGAQACPESPDRLNNLAWALASVPSADLRDGPRAIGIAESALDALGKHTAVYLDTLAAAHAEAGDFAEARRVMDEALGMLAPEGSEATDLRPILRQHRSGFEAGRPIRDPEQ